LKKEILSITAISIKIAKKLGLRVEDIFEYIEECGAEK